MSDQPPAPGPGPATGPPPPSGQPWSQPPPGFGPSGPGGQPGYGAQPGYGTQPGYGPPPGSGYGGGPAPGAQPGYGAQPGPGYPPGGGGGHGPPPGPGFGGPVGVAPLGWVATPWGPRWRGPVGSAKPAGITILLSIVTCGIWTYVWSYQTHEDLKRYRGDGIGGGIALVIAFVASVGIMFSVPMEVEQMYQEEGLVSPVKTLDGLWFLLPIIGNFIWYLKVQRALNDFWVARGAAPA